MRNQTQNIVLRLTALAALGLAGVPVAFAHDVPCPLCGLKLVQATKDRDNEVVLRYGKKRIEYRCVDCVLADAKAYAGDLIVYAPSETKGKPVLLKRSGGAWKVVRDEGGKLVPEEGAVFLNAFKNHAQCAALSRAFHTKAGFDAYVAESGVKDAKALTLDAMVAGAGAK